MILYNLIISESDKIKYIGVDDTTLDFFESQYAVPDGVSYNSYVILDDKTAIMDTVDKRGMKDWENNLLNALDGRNADYVIIQHMEPDHAGSLARLIELFPEITVVGNAKTFVMINQFFENINIKNSLKKEILLILVPTLLLLSWRQWFTGLRLW